MTFEPQKMDIFAEGTFYKLPQAPRQSSCISAVRALLSILMSAGDGFRQGWSNITFGDVSMFECILVSNSLHLEVSGVWM